MVVDDLSLHEHELPAFLSISLAVICFIIYWFIGKSPKTKEKYFSKKTALQNRINFIVFGRLFGFLMMGLVPITVCFFVIPDFKWENYGITINPEKIQSGLFWWGILSIPLLIINFFNAKRPETLSIYPEFKAKEWDLSLVLKNELSWGVYFLGYETMFRGILLFPLAEAMGVWPAIAVNLMLYAISHLPKGLAETVGAIPIGIPMCLMTLYTGMIWPSLALHITLSWSNNLLATHYHPEMKFVRKKR